MIENVPDQDVNGFLAGYVSEKILLGDSKPAWALMLDYYDKASDWGLEICDKPLNDDGECPGKEIKLSFPDALERMHEVKDYAYFGDEIYAVAPGIVVAAEDGLPEQVPGKLPDGATIQTAAGNHAAFGRSWRDDVDTDQWRTPVLDESLKGNAPSRGEAVKGR